MEAENPKRVFLNSINNMKSLYSILEDSENFFKDRVEYFIDTEIKLPDIVKGNHGKWINFKYDVVESRRFICDFLTTNHNDATIKILECIIGQYVAITEFINNHRTDIPEDEVIDSSREGIALELRNEINRTITTLCKIVPDIILPNTVFTNANKDSPKIENNKIPDIWGSEKARSIIEGLLSKGFIIRDKLNSYRWNKSKGLYGYFVDISSEILQIRPSNSRIPWSIYSLLISNHEELLPSAKQAVNNYSNKELNKPQGYEVVYEMT